ncbi:MAG: hypothetical protein ACRDQV_16685 [Pseudonocardiaceae bacterium]
MADPPYFTAPAPGSARSFVLAALHLDPVLDDGDRGQDWGRTDHSHEPVLRPPRELKVPLLVPGHVAFVEVDGLAVGRERDVDVAAGGVGIGADTMPGPDQLDGRRGVAD